MEKIKDLLRRLFRRKKAKPTVAYMDTDSVHVILDTEPGGFTQEKMRQIIRRAKEKTGETIEEYRARKRFDRVLDDMTRKRKAAIHQDLGRHMKPSKGHHQTYRKSTKEKVNPEDEEE